MSADGKREDGEGTIEIRGPAHATRAYGRVRHPTSGARVWLPLGKGLSTEQARAKLDAFMARGRAQGRLGELIDLWLAKNPHTSRGRQAREGKLVTVREIGTAFTNGDLLKKHGPVNGLRPMGSHKEHNSGGYNANAVMKKRAYDLRTRGPGGPKFGDLPAADVKCEDIAMVMAQQPGGSAGTRNHVHGTLSRIMSLAEVPLGLRPHGTNPVLKAYRAPRDPDKLFNYLYPSEVLALLANRKLPLGRRVLYLLAAYFG